MTTDTRIRRGDVIEHRRKSGEVTRQYRVVGRTKRGKLRLRRASGTEVTVWWSRVGDLPPSYSVVGK